MKFKFKKLIKLRYIKLVLFRLLKFRKSKWKNTKYFTINKIKKLIKHKKYQRRKISSRKKSRRRLTSRLPLHIHISNKKFNYKKKKLKIKTKFKKRVLRYIAKRYNKKRQFLFNFIDQFKIKGILGKFMYLNKYYKDVINTRLIMKFIFNQKNKSIKSKYPNKLNFLKHVYSNFFSVSGTLKTLFFYKTFENINTSFKEKKIMLNDFAIEKNINLCKGDIISIHENDISVQPIIRTALYNYSFLNYLEYDMYTQKYVVIKNLDNLSKNDYNLMTVEYINKQHI